MDTYLLDPADRAAAARFMPASGCEKWAATVGPGATFLATSLAAAFPDDVSAVPARAFAYTEGERDYDALERALERCESARLVLIVASRDEPERPILDGALIRSVASGEPVAVRRAYEDERRFRVRARLMVHSDRPVEVRGDPRRGEDVLMVACCDTRTAWSADDVDVTAAAIRYGVARVGA